MTETKVFAELGIDGYADTIPIYLYQMRGSLMTVEVAYATPYGNDGDCIYPSVACSAIGEKSVSLTASVNMHQGDIYAHAQYLRVWYHTPNPNSAKLAFRAYYEQKVIELEAELDKCRRKAVLTTHDVVDIQDVTKTEFKRRLTSNI